MLTIAQRNGAPRAMKNHCIKLFYHVFREIHIQVLPNTRWETRNPFPKTESVLFLPAKKSGSTRSEFCEILSPVTDIFLLKNSATPTRLVSLRPCECAPHILTPSISQNFARVPHFCTPPPLPQNIVAERRAFSRTSASAEALCEAQSFPKWKVQGNATHLLCKKFAQMLELLHQTEARTKNSPVQGTVFCNK